MNEFITSSSNELNDFDHRVESFVFSIKENRLQLVQVSLFLLLSKTNSHHNGFNVKHSRTVFPRELLIQIIFLSSTEVEPVRQSGRMGSDFCLFVIFYL